MTNLVIERNLIDNIAGPNSHVLIVDGPGYEDLTIRNNIFENIGSIGLILGDSAAVQKENQEEYENKEVSRYILPSVVKEVDIYNNTFYKAGPNDGVEFHAPEGSGILGNNIFIGSDTYFHAGMTVARGYNDYYESESNLALGTGDSTLNPRLANPARGDFHETEASPTINTGDNGALVPVRTSDFEGNQVVGTVDKGAYEYQLG